MNNNIENAIDIDSVNKSKHRKIPINNIVMIALISLCGITVIALAGIWIKINGSDLVDSLNEDNGVQFLIENDISQPDMLTIGFMASTDKDGYGFVASLDVENMSNVLRLSNEDYYIDIMYSDDVTNKYSKIVRLLTDKIYIPEDYLKIEDVDSEHIKKAMNEFGDSAYSKDGAYDVYMVKSTHYITCIVDVSGKLNETSINNLCYRLNKYILESVEQ